MEIVQSPKLLEEIRYTTERRMAFCGTCGVGIGIMTQAEFEDRFIEFSGLCPVCGGKIAPTPVKEKKELFPPEIQRYLTPKLFVDVLREIFAEREKDRVHLRLLGC